MALKGYNSDSVKDQFVKCLILGPGGTGKTSLLATAPKPVVFSFEPGGTISLKGKGIQCYDVGLMSEIDEALELVKKTSPSTVGIDSVTAMTNLVFKSVKAENPNLYVDARKFYPEYRARAWKYINGFLSLNCHLVMTAQEAKAVNELNGASYSYARMPCAQLENDLPFAFNQVFQTYVHVDNKEQTRSYWVLTNKSDTNDPVKNKGGSLAQYEPPDLTAIFNKILA